MVGFEVEVGPVLLDPGGGVVQVVKAARWGDWLGGWGRRGSGLGLRLGLKVAIIAPRDEPCTSDVRVLQPAALLL